MREMVATPAAVRLFKSGRWVTANDDGAKAVLDPLLNSRQASLFDWIWNEHFYLFYCEAI
jgi:hypothetical protein